MKKTIKIKQKISSFFLMIFVLSFLSPFLSLANNSRKLWFDQTYPDALQQMRAYFQTLYKNNDSPNSSDKPKLGITIVTYNLGMFYVEKNCQQSKQKLFAMPLMNGLACGLKKLVASKANVPGHKERLKTLPLFLKKHFFTPENRAHVISFQEAFGETRELLESLATQYNYSIYPPKGDKMAPLHGLTSFISNDILNPREKQSPKIYQFVKYPEEFKEWYVAILDNVPPLKKIFNVDRGCVFAKFYIAPLQEMAALSNCHTAPTIDQASLRTHQIIYHKKKFKQFGLQKPVAKQIIEQGDFNLGGGWAEGSIRAGTDFNDPKVTKDLKQDYYNYRLLTNNNPNSPNGVFDPDYTKALDPSEAFPESLPLNNKISSKQQFNNLASYDPDRGGLACYHPMTGKSDINPSGSYKQRIDYQLYYQEMPESFTIKPKKFDIGGQEYVTTITLSSYSTVQDICKKYDQLLKVNDKEGQRPFKILCQQQHKMQQNPLFLKIQNKFIEYFQESKCAFFNNFLLKNLHAHCTREVSTQVHKAFSQSKNREMVYYGMQGIKATLELLEETGIPLQDRKILNLLYSLIEIFMEPKIAHVIISPDLRDQLEVSLNILEDLRTEKQVSLSTIDLKYLLSVIDHVLDQWFTIKGIPSNQSDHSFLRSTLELKKI